MDNLKIIGNSGEWTSVVPDLDDDLQLVDDLKIFGNSGEWSPGTTMMKLLL